MELITRKREWYRGAIYHVTVRGNRRNDIFRDKEDFEYYLNTVASSLHGPEHVETEA